jgi:uncharacterized protein YdaU (DUF1376 family)
MTTKHPYMPLFFGDFLASTADWEGEEQSLYLLLLGYQWSLGSLPSDPRKLCKLVRWDADSFERYWPTVSTKFEALDGRLVNSRLEQHRAKAFAISEKRSASGKAGAGSRWQDDGKPMANATDLLCHPIQSNPIEEEEKKDVPSGDVVRVFGHWQTVHGKARAKLDDKRKRLIRAALKIHSADDLCRCISGYKRSPFHQGKNDRGVVYDDIGLMLRDAKQIEQGIAHSETTVSEVVRWR